MLKLLRVLALLLLASPAFAQSQVPSGYVQGNASATSGLMKASPLTDYLDRVFGSTTDKMIYRGSGGWVTTTLSTYARTLIDDADAATARATLGLSIGGAVQAWDADLDCLAALSTTGLIARTGAATCATRTLTAPAAGITVSNGDGVSGNPTLVLANDLAALEGLSGTGIARRTGTDAWSVGTAVANSELATMAANTTKCNATAGTAVPTDCTASTMRTNIGVVIGTNVQAWDADLDAFAANSTTGFWAYTGAGTGAARTITGTANEITVTNGAGTAGNPVVSLPSALTFTGKTVAGGTFNSPAITTPTGIVKGDVGLGNVANVDTTNASNISSGTLPAARLPNPSASTLGGIQSAAAVTNQWINSISTSGVPALSQPAFSNLSGSWACSQAAAHTGDVTTSAGSCATTLATAQPAVHTWALAQTFTVAPVFTDQSGSRTALGLGTAATQNTGTSGANVPLLNGANVFSGNTSIGASGIAADATLTISNNTASTAAPTANSGLHLVGANTDNNTFVLDGFGGQNYINARSADGTAASKTATISGRKLLRIDGTGWDGSAYTPGASIFLVTAEAWGGSAHGAYIDINTTPTGSTTINAPAARFQPSGALAIGVTTDSGAGTVQLKKQTFASLTLCSSTLEGAMASVTDSSTATWGATITGGSTNHVMGYCNGTNWTVAAK